MENNQLQELRIVQENEEDFNRLEEAKKFLRDFWGLIDKKELAIDIALVIFIAFVVIKG
jgi:hypothetical protein